MPREVTEDDEKKYGEEKKTIRERMIEKARKLLAAKKDPSAVSMRNERNMSEMESPEASMPIREATLEMDIESLKIRRALEFELVARADKSKVDTRTECWYLMDTHWLAEWTCFVEGKQNTLPPQITSNFLLGKEDKKGNREPRDNLELKLHYRGVPPLVFHILKELYGHDKSPPICRFLLDIYAPAVPDVERIRIQEKPMKEARVMVNEVRSAWTTWDEVEDLEDQDLCCCGLTKDHIEAIIYWIVRCCARKSAGRDDISYRDYNTVSRGDDETDDFSSQRVEIDSIKDRECVNESEMTRLNNDEDSSDRLEREYGRNGVLYMGIWKMFGLV